MPNLLVIATLPLGCASTMAIPCTTVTMTKTMTFNTVTIGISHTMLQVNPPTSLASEHGITRTFIYIPIMVPVVPITSWGN